MLSRAFNKFAIRQREYKQQPKKNPSRPSTDGCYKCRRKDHFIADCPKMEEEEKIQRKQKKKHFKKKALAAGTWDDLLSGESEQEDQDDEVANICLMALSDDEER